MGNCGSSINCTAVNQPVEANPDVAGIGALVSFVATAVITFIAIVVGYLSDSLPDTSLSQLDRACIAKFASIKWRPWIKDGPTSLLLRRSMTAAMGVLGWDSAAADHDEGIEDDEKSRHARERRSKGLEKFILALSDQQLVTGLAVLIAGFVSPCSMSIYHFNVIAALGWFSSTTHLSTLAVLRVYFIEHPRLRNWRVVAMLFVLVLLIIARVVTLASTLDNSLPVRCALTHGSSENLEYVSILSIVGIMVFLGATYSARIVRLYSLDPEWSVQAWFVNSVVMVWDKKAPSSNLTEIAIVCSKLPQVEQHKIRRKLKERQQYLGQELVKIVIKSSDKSKVEQGVLWRSLNERIWYTRLSNLMRSKRSANYKLSQGILHSFLSDLFTLQFGIALGITQVIVSRLEEPSAGVVGSQNDINFGQLVPLLLMLLPIFAAGEVYLGNNNNIHAQGLILIALSLERREDMLTKPSNNKISSPNQTHGKPFFSRTIGLADIFRLSDGTQLSSDNTPHTLDASSFLQSSPSVGGSTRIELQNLPTGRLRRPDTETGLRAPTTNPSELTRSPSRSPVPEIGYQPEQTREKPPNLWRNLTRLVAGLMIFQTLLAIALGGVPGGGVLSVLGGMVILGYLILVCSGIIASIVTELEKSANA